MGGEAAPLGARGGISCSGFPGYWRQRRACSVDLPSKAFRSVPEDDGERFEGKVQRLVATVDQQQVDPVKIDAAITADLEEVGYGQ